MKKLTIFFVLVFIASSAAAQWVKSGYFSPPSTVLAFAKSGTNIFVANGGVLLSSDHGASWNKINGVGGEAFAMKDSNSVPCGGLREWCVCLYKPRLELDFV